ncbi:MAG: hypothetical protein WBU92_03560, partial [Candidatus Dormiibacterota bacterium]
MIPAAFSRHPAWREPEAAPHDILALLRAQEWERKWLAEQLSDDPLQTLSQISRLLGVATEGSAPVARVRENAREAARLAAGVSDRLRSLARELRPSLLDDFGLVQALRSLTSEFGLRTGIAVRFAVVGSGITGGGDQDLTCYRVAQEALSRVERRRGATQAELRLVLRPGSVRMLIVDDGKGPGAADFDRGRGWGLG